MNKVLTYRLELKPPKGNEQDEEKIEDVKENDDNDNQGVDVKNEDVEMKEEDAEEIAEVCFYFCLI